MARGVGELAACALGLTAAPHAERGAPPHSRTKWTRRVPHPVLIGHAASAQSGVQHCVTHPVRVVGLSTARIEQCWVKNCGRPFGQDTEGSIKVM